MYNLEHPDISRIRATGYSNVYREEKLCEMCGENPIDEKYYELNGMEVCESCMIAAAAEELRSNPEYAAEILGTFAVVSV